MALEKVVTWLWRENLNEKRREDAYWFDTEGAKIIVVRGDEKPEGSKAILDAIEVMVSYKLRGRRKLTEHSQIMYDYLEAKGF